MERYISVPSFILTGASGAGKSSVAKRLEAITHGPVRFVREKAVVTRAQRNPEDDDYIFVTDERYDEMRRAGRFILETPSYNYRGAVRHYNPTSPNAYPLYILTPRNAQRLQDVLLPRPRIVHIDRYALDANAALLNERPDMTPADIETRLQQGASDRVTARGIEDIGIDNDQELDLTVARLYDIMSEEVLRRRAS